ncbi:hypothetical protein KHA94_07620 [Bacillus sp. FJAT-49705]|uniref:Sporulation protein n=1 Tax=Cytobacillus citreus TaxID=2833586 RepID=A0ABS5NR61_9BACI|nr:hypothetical protein [Cytobacillus citreus]MBS4190071.1 hypothetical protein [Cytobacillus citreus]
MKRFGVFILLLAFLAGCTNFNRGVEEFSGTNEDNDNISNVSNRLDREDTQEWTMDSQNPNFLPLDRRDNVSDQSDINKARQVIEETGTYRAGQVWINGDDMWVTAYKKGMMTESEKVDASSKLRKQLLKALPRYHIEVKVQEDRT